MEFTSLGWCQWSYNRDDTVARFGNGQRGRARRRCTICGGACKQRQLQKVGTRREDTGIAGFVVAET
jgi:hypothetical protein